MRLSILELRRVARLTAVSASALAAIALVGCGGTTSPSTPAPAPTTASTPAPTAEPSPTAAPTETATPAATPPATPAATPAGGGGGTAGTRDAIIDNFTLPSFTITAGTTVTFRNDDSAPHTATADDGSFDSGTLSGTRTFDHTFTTAGRFSYHCAIHPDMTGVITVQ